RLVWLEFPRVKVEHCRKRSTLALRLSQAHTDQPRGKHAKIAPAANGYVQTTNSKSQGGQLEDAMVDTLGPERRSGRLRHAVTLVAHGIDRRIVLDSRLDQHVESPCCLANEAERRRAIARDRRADRLLQGIFALTQVVFERGGIQRVQPSVVPAMAS